MKVIITHKNTDFDGIASLVAAHKLFPDATPVLGHTVNRRVNNFLALHKNSFDFTSPEDIIWENVSEIIMVDFHELILGDCLENIKDFSKIKWSIYDHHPEQLLEIAPLYSEIKETGSTVGIIIKHLKEKNIKPTLIEATLMAIGIYSDTGHLTFPNTKVDDVLAVAWLLENNADLNIVADYTKLALQDEQIEVMNKLIENIEIEDFAGTKVLFSSQRVDVYIPDLSIISYKLSELFSVDMIFISVKMQKLSYIIGQSRNSDFNVLKFMSDFEPNGHENAGFARTELFEPEEIINNIRTKLQTLRTNKIIARKIMSTPVRTISKISTIETAQKLMLRYGHNGFVIVDDNIVEGIISRRDIEKAMHHKMHASLVQDLMSKNIVTINPYTTFDEIEKIITEHNMGRFPVIEKGKLVGIVTRTDILKTRYNKDFKQNLIYDPTGSIESDIYLINKMNKYFTKEVMSFLETAGKLADKFGYRVYLVGGGVRDLILENLQDVDIDIVVEGNGLHFAEKLAEKYSAHLTIHEKYGTAKIKMQNGTVDIATARTEFYEYPAASPDVHFSTVKQDLYRRDFTINALAIHLNTDSFGKILDFFNGYKDLKNKCIRILHSLSFIEDPNRIFRAVRLERKLGFTIEHTTAEMAIKAMDTGNFDHFINARIKTEVKILLSNRYKPIQNIKRLYELHALRCIEPLMEFNLIEKKLKRAQKYTEMFGRYVESDLKDWLIYIIILLNQIKEESDFEKMIKLIKLEREEEKSVRMSKELTSSIDKYNWKEIPGSDIFYFWKKYSSETIIYAMATIDDKFVKKAIFKYWTKLKDITLEIDGKYLKSHGISQGTIIGDILESIILAKLNGQVNNLNEEYNYARKLIEEYK